MLNIAIPNGIENGIFQFVKVALSSVVALFGTYQIAANGVAQSIWSLAALMGAALGPVYITVIGQCMGNGDKEQAKYYFKKLNKWSIGLSIIWNAFILAITPVLMHFYQLSSETITLIFYLVVIHNVFNAIVYPISGPLSNGLRAAGDVKFTAGLSLVSVTIIRPILTWLFCYPLAMGLFGAWISLFLDQFGRYFGSRWRYKKGKWLDISI